RVLDPARNGDPPWAIGEPERLQERIEAGGEEALAQEDRDRDAERAADREPEEGRVQRPRDRGQDPELTLVRIPRGPGEEGDSVAADCRLRRARDVPDHVQDEADRCPGE